MTPTTLTAPAHGTGQLVEDEDLAIRCPSTNLLITAPAPSVVEHLAWRIHSAGTRAAFPFVHRSASCFPLGTKALSQTCAGLRAAAVGGTILITDIEQIPVSIQDQFMDMVAEWQNPRDSSRSVRLIAGTTASLRDCVATRGFSESLFYRLNTIHIVVR